jgi:hypothetical protein
MATLTTAGPHGGTNDIPDRGEVSIDETRRLIASNKVEGTQVYNRQGDHLGEIYTLMVDKRSGQVAYAVMSFGGFLGIGESYHPLPWRALDYDPNVGLDPAVGGYVVDLSREQLEGGPRYGRDEDPWTDAAYGRSVDEHYGLGARA